MNNPVFSIHAFARFPALTFRYGIALSLLMTGREILHRLERVLLIIF